MFEITLFYGSLQTDLGHGQSDGELEGADHHIQNWRAPFVHKLARVPGHLVAGLALKNPPKYPLKVWHKLLSIYNKIVISMGEYNLSLDVPKSILETEKNPKNFLSGANIFKKKQKKPKKTGFFPTLPCSP